MVTRDLLSELYLGRITIDEAYQIYDEIMDSARAPYVAELLEMSDQEWTAYAQGASFGDIARWRFDGWPTRCAECGRSLNPSTYRWTVRQVNGSTTLVHLGHKRINELK